MPAACPMNAPFVFHFETVAAAIPPVSRTVWGAGRTVRRAARVVWGAPRAGRPHGPVVRGAPQRFWGAPQTVRGGSTGPFGARPVSSEELAGSSGAIFGRFGGRGGRFGVRAEPSKMLPKRSDKRPKPSGARPKRFEMSPFSMNFALEPLDLQVFTRKTPFSPQILARPTAGASAYMNIATREGIAWATGMADGEAVRTFSKPGGPVSEAKPQQKAKQENETKYVLSLARGSAGDLADELLQ